MRGHHGRLRRDRGAGGRALIVDIHYRRLPDDVTVFRQELVLDRDDVKVTLARSVELEEPVVVEGRIVLEPGADAVWFTFPGLWHDIGRFHRRDGAFTGVYANVLTPPELDDVGPHDDPDAGPEAAPRRDSSPGSEPEVPPDGGPAGSGRRVWRTTDLFLDVWLPPEGGLHVLDRDQLRDALDRGWIDREAAARAEDEVRSLEAAHARGAWPPAVVDEWTLERARAAASQS